MDSCQKKKNYMMIKNDDVTAETETEETEEVTEESCEAEENSEEAETEEKSEEKKGFFQKEKGVIVIGYKGAFSGCQLSIAVQRNAILRQLRQMQIFLIVIVLVFYLWQLCLQAV